VDEEDEAVMSTLQLASVCGLVETVKVPINGIALQSVTQVVFDECC
jgi:hypothetical protein